MQLSLRAFDFMFSKVNFQFTLFIYALSYFTRLPIPASTKFDNAQFYKGAAYLPVIGAVVALLLISSFWLFTLLFNIEISLIFTLIVAVFVTGALHEDGFADCCDGLGGGYRVEQRLEIMKDSQIGSYAAIGLVLLILLKMTALLTVAELGETYLFSAFFAAQVLSRYCVLLVKESMPYARRHSGGKVNSLAERLTPGYLLFASLVSFLPFIFQPLLQSFLLVASLSVLVLFFRQLFKKQLGGYTGDCLGLVQQITEVSCYLLLGVAVI